MVEFIQMAETQLADQSLRLQQYCEENDMLAAKITRVRRRKRCSDRVTVSTFFSCPVIWMQQ